jgi:hypothetical protein
MESLEFLIEIGEREADGYRLQVEAPGVRHVTYAAVDPEDPDLRRLLENVPGRLLESSARTRFAAHSPAEKALRQLGTRLFQTIMVDEVPGRLGSALDRAQEEGRDLRIALRIRPAELQTWPWELMYDPRRHKEEFVGKNALLVRTPEALAAMPPLRVTGPLRILGVVATPSDQPDLQAVAGERAMLDDALADVIEAGQVELDWAAPTKEGLHAALRRGPWHVLHFIGHGDFDAANGQGRLWLCGPDGRGDALLARELANMFQEHRSLRMAVLNACQSAYGDGIDPYSSMAAALVRARVPAVVAMQYPITDDAAEAFTAPFYEGLAAGQPADVCMRFGRQGISFGIQGSLEWSTPVLYLSSSSGRVFDRGLGDADDAAFVEDDLGEGGPIQLPPPAPIAIAAAAPWLDGHEVTAVTSSGGLVRRWWNERDGWQDPEAMDLPTAVVDLSAYSRTESRMDCIVADGRGRIRRSSYHGDRWHSWHTMHAPDETPKGRHVASPEVTRVAAQSSAPGHAELFAVTAAGELVHRWHWSEDAEAEPSWSEWEVFDTVTPVADVAATSARPDAMLCVVADVHGRIWRSNYTDRDWSAWHRMRLPSKTESLRIVRVAAGSLAPGHSEIFAVTAEGELIHRYQWEGSPWDPWARFATPDRVVDVATVTHRDGPYDCFIVDVAGRTWTSRFDRETYWSAWTCPSE